VVILVIKGSARLARSLATVHDWVHFRVTVSGGFPMGTQVMMTVCLFAPRWHCPQGRLRADIPCDCDSLLRCWVTGACQYWAWRRGGKGTCPGEGVAGQTWWGAGSFSLTWEEDRQKGAGRNIVVLDLFFQTNITISIWLFLAPRPEISFTMVSAQRDTEIALENSRTTWMSLFHSADLLIELPSLFLKPFVSLARYGF
jgi:hypothetical protein